MESNLSDRENRQGIEVIKAVLGFPDEWAQAHYIF
jgi:hypothetical protein